jgi:hypothetical protein
MTPNETTAELRRLAEKATAGTASGSTYWANHLDCIRWQDATQPSAIIALLDAQAELRGEVERLREALTVIVDGKVPTQHQNGYYLAHRNAVYVARAALAKGDA